MLKTNQGPILNLYGTRWTKHAISYTARHWGAVICLAKIMLLTVCRNRLRSPSAWPHLPNIEMLVKLFVDDLWWSDVDFTSRIALRYSKTRAHNIEATNSNPSTIWHAFGPPSTLRRAIMDLDSMTKNTPRWAIIMALDTMTENTASNLDYFGESGTLMVCK